MSDDGRWRGREDRERIESDRRKAPAMLVVEAIVAAGAGACTVQVVLEKGLAGLAVKQTVDCNRTLKSQCALHEKSDAGTESCTVLVKEHIDRW